MIQSAEPTDPHNAFGITTLVLAALGLMFGLVAFTRFLALILGLLAVLFGLLSWSHIRQGAATNRSVTVLGMLLAIGAATLGGWGIAVGLGAFGTPGNDSPTGGDPAAMGDVAIVGCSITVENGVSNVHITVRITNNTDRAQTYLATIAVDDASGMQAGKINVVGNSLVAGQSVTTSGWEASGTAASGARPGPARCVVATVNRVPAPITCPPGEVDVKLC